MWCRAFVGGIREKYLQTDPARVASEMTSLKTDADLAPIRDADDLSDDWKRFWADVDALMERARDKG